MGSPYNLDFTSHFTQIPYFLSCLSHDAMLEVSGNELGNNTICDY